MKEFPSRKFRLGQKVKVVDGFYRGRNGVVIGVEHHFDAIYYSVSFRFWIFPTFYSADINQDLLAEI